MSNGKSGRKKKLDKKTIITMVVLMLVSVLVTILFPEDDTAGTNSTTPRHETTESTHTSENSSTQNIIGEVTDGTLIFTMVDVGQADGFVLEYEDMVAVIDCGTDSTCDNMVNYLRERGIRKN